MTLSPEARMRAREIAEAAPPFSPAIRDQVRLILWGSPAPNSAQADPATDAADAALSRAFQKAQHDPICTGRCVTRPEKDSGRPPGDDRPELMSSPRTADQHPAQGVPSLPRVTPRQPAESYLMTDLPEPIASRISIDLESGCWKVSGNLDKNGYARIGGEGAHRVVYKLLVGPIPEGLVLDHVEARGCIWRCCAWPAHLEPVTPAVNTLRGNSPHAINARKDRCDSGHPFDLLNTYWRPSGARDCRACIRRRVAEYQQRQRESALELRAAA